MSACADRYVSATLGGWLRVEAHMHDRAMALRGRGVPQSLGTPYPSFSSHVRRVPRPARGDDVPSQSEGRGHEDEKAYHHRPLRRVSVRHPLRAHPRDGDLPCCERGEGKADQRVEEHERDGAEDAERRVHRCGGEGGGEGRGSRKRRRKGVGLHTSLPFSCPVRSWGFIRGLPLIRCDHSRLPTWCAPSVFTKSTNL